MAGTEAGGLPTTLPIPVCSSRAVLGLFSSNWCSTSTCERSEGGKKFVGEQGSLKKFVVDQGICMEIRWFLEFEGVQGVGRNVQQFHGITEGGGVSDFI